MGRPQPIYAALLLGIVLAWTMAEAPRLRGEIRPESATPGAAGSTAAAASADPMQEITPEREAAAETFARLHHPELADLLQRLKAAQHADYDNAVRDLFRESERLARLKSRDAARYDLELQIWKVSSRIRLATARLAMEDSDSLRTELRNLLRERVALRARLVQQDREKVSIRLQKLDADLESLTSDPDALVDEDLERLIKSAHSSAASARKPRPSRNPGGAASPSNPQNVTTPSQTTPPARTPPARPRERSGTQK